MADNSIKYSDLFPDDGGIDALIKKIQEVEAVYKKVTNTIANQTKKLKGETENLNVTDEKSNDLLKKKEKELDKILKQLDDLNDVEDELLTQKKQALKLAKEEQRLIEKRNSLTTDAAKKNAKLKIEISELNKELKEQAKESAGLVGEYDKQSKRLNKLRKEYKNLAAAGQANSKAAQDLLKEVKELDTKLKDIDASVGQFQRNVGNYGEAVREAAEATKELTTSMVGAIDKSGVLGEVIGKLEIIIGFLSKAKEKLTEETDENTVATEVNDKTTKKATITQRLFGKTVLGSRRAVNLLNKALKASIIGAIVVALGSLAAFLTKTQAGLTKLKAITLASSAILSELSDRLIKLGPALIALGKTLLVPIRAVLGGLQTLNKGFSALALKIVSLAQPFSEEAKKASEQATAAFSESASELGKVFTDVPDDIAKAFNGVVDAVDGVGDAINNITKTAEPLAKTLNDIELANAQISKELAERLAVSEKLEEIEGDATKSFAEREKAIRGSIAAQKEAADLQLTIAENNLKAFELENAFTAQSLEDTNEIKIQRIELEKEVLEAKKEASIKSLALTRVANQLEQDLIEKNLDILIDGFDNQKTINEQLIADEKQRFVERRKLLNETLALQKSVLAEEVKEIQKTTKKTIDIQDLIATSDSKRLNEKIRLLGLSEILEGRLLEVIRDNRTATNDLAVASKELNQSRIDFLKETIQATEDLKVANETNLEAQAQLEEQYRFERVNAELDAQLKVAEGDLELTENLLKKKEELNKEHDKKVNENRINAFVEANDREAKQLEIDLLNQGETEKEISQALRDDKIKDLEDEIKLKKELNTDALDDELELARLKAQKEKDIEEEKYKELNALRDSFIQGALDGIDKQLQKEIEANQKRQDDIKDQINKQQELAKEGLTNTLAFEEAELAKAEQEKIELEKKRIRVEEVKALYSAYSAAASSGDPDAITKALRDFAILRATSAAVQSFGEGTGEHGTFADAIDARTGGSSGGNSLLGGIFSGAKHDSKGRGGIPVLVEGNEGLLSSSQMNKFGKSNFIKLTKGIDNGTIGTDFFGGQIGMIPQTNVFSVNMDSLEGKLDSVQRAIENKPVPSLHAESISESITDIVHTVQTGNKTVKSRYRLNKRRL